MLDQGLGGWFSCQAANFLFDLPIFWVKNSLKHPRKIWKLLSVFQHLQKMRGHIFYTYGPSFNGEGNVYLHSP
jgi:hypothetical protein